MIDCEYANERNPMHLWQRSDLGNAWSQVQVPESGLILLSSAQVDKRVEALIVPYEENSRSHAALIASPTGTEAVLVNGVRCLGVTRLQERDEIGIVRTGERFFFSGADPIERGSFPEGEPETRCVRCKDVLRAGDPVVRCSCRGWFHEGAIAEPEEEPRNCFTYRATCPACGRAADQGSWRPEDCDA